MIRFFMVRREKLISGAERESFYSIDDDTDELEIALNSGGVSEDQYETHHLLGVEVVTVEG